MVWVLVAENFHSTFWWRWWRWRKPSTPSTPTHPDAPNSDQSIICPHVTVRGFTGSVQEVIDSVNDTTIGRNTLGAEDTKTQPLNYDDVKVTVSKEDGSGAFTVNVGSDGTYSQIY